ncbi:hypothetical protein [Micromonospora sp. NPDC005324]|uniref:hypothetical protein n=1 Tax=Micromonospora sp. NPDC005324 TaxID=3157033 RepID=UPI0033B8BC99
MTGPEHYREAEKLLGQADGHQRATPEELSLFAEAQVHATLALAATTAASDPDEGWTDIRRDGGS